LALSDSKVAVIVAEPGPTVLSNPADEIEATADGVALQVAAEVTSLVVLSL